jgi:hypothetical protein
MDTNTLDANTFDNTCSLAGDSGGLTGGLAVNSSGGISPVSGATVVPEPNFLIVPLGFGMLGLALMMRTRAKAKARERKVS